MPWSDLRTIVDARPEPSDRSDCPVCGEPLDHNGKEWNCPRQGAAHYRSPQPPRD